MARRRADTRQFDRCQSDSRHGTSNKRQCQVDRRHCGRSASRHSDRCQIGMRQWDRCQGDGRQFGSLLRLQVGFVSYEVHGVVGLRRELVAEGTLLEGTLDQLLNLADYEDRRRQAHQEYQIWEIMNINMICLHKTRVDRIHIGVRIIAHALRVLKIH